MEGEREEDRDPVEATRSIEDDDELDCAVCMGAVSIGSGKTDEVTWAPGKVTSLRTTSVKEEK